VELSEAMKLVLKTKSKMILNEFRKEDFKKITKETFGIMADKNFSFKDSLKNFKTKTLDLLQLPRRIRRGFVFLKNDFLDELDRMQDQKQKTVFSLKFIGALSRMSLGSLYNLRMGKTRYTFIQVIIIGICMEFVKGIVARFLDEVEKELTNADEIKNIRYFKSMIRNAASPPEDLSDPWMAESPNDKSFQIVEAFKEFNLNGQRT